MGSGGNKTASLPPPPTPTPTQDVATTAAEAALAARMKDSYASSTEDPKKKADLGATVAPAAPSTRKREPAPAGMVPAAGLGGSAVLTG